MMPPSHITTIISSVPTISPLLSRITIPTISCCHHRIFRSHFMSPLSYHLSPPFHIAILPSHTAIIIFVPSHLKPLESYNLSLPSHIAIKSSIPTIKVYMFNLLLRNLFYIFHHQSVQPLRNLFILILS